MPRPRIERAIGGLLRVTLFKPAGIPSRELEQLPLAMDELEAIRLVDLEGLSHEQAASVMGVSRQTVGRVLEARRATVADALGSGKALLIGGGQYRIEPRQLCCRACGAVWAAGESHAPRVSCPSCGSTDVGTCWDPVGRCGIGREHEGGGSGRREEGCDAGMGPRHGDHRARGPSPSTAQAATTESGQPIKESESQ